MKGFRHNLITRFPCGESGFCERDPEKSFLKQRKNAGLELGITLVLERASSVYCSSRLEVPVKGSVKSIP